MHGFFFLGILAGSALGLPIGPNGSLCLYRSIRFGWRHGAATALGSVLSMTLYALVSFMILSLFGGMVTGADSTINAINGVCSLLIGIVFVKAAPSSPSAAQDAPDRKMLFFNFSSSFLISITNPKNIIGFAALLVAYSPKAATNLFSWLNAVSFGFGVFLSTTCFFLILIALSITIGERFLKGVIPKLKYWVAVIFILSGVVSLARAFRPW